MTCTHIETLIFSWAQQHQISLTAHLASLSWYRNSFIHDFQLLYLYGLVKQCLFSGAFSPTFFSKKAKVNILDAKKRNTEEHWVGRLAPEAAGPGLSLWALPSSQSSTRTQWHSVHTCAHTPSFLQDVCSMQSLAVPTQPWQQHCWARGAELSDIPELPGRTASSSLWQFSPHNITISQTHL